MPRAAVTMVCWTELTYGLPMSFELAGFELIPLAYCLIVRVCQHRRMLKEGRERWVHLVEASILCAPALVLIPIFPATDITAAFQPFMHFQSQIRRLIEVALLALVPLSYFPECALQSRNRGRVPVER
jgi:hypothetical protein